MTKSVMRHLAKVVRSRSKGGFAVLKKVSDAHIKVGLVAAVETKAILALESSQYPFEVTADHRQSMYR